MIFLKKIDYDSLACDDCRLYAMFDQRSMDLDFCEHTTEAAMARFPDRVKTKERMRVVSKSYIEELENGFNNNNLI